MRLRPLLLAAALVSSAASCGQAIAPADAGDAAPRPDGARSESATPIPGTDADTRDVRYRDVPVDPDPFREDACPEPPPPLRQYDCDPTRLPSQCPAGQGCYPWVEYPGDRCGQLVYHATCLEAGTVPLMGLCGGGAACGPGLTCFGTPTGNRCLRLCRLDGTGDACPRGQVCEPTDLADYGACD